MRLKPLLQFRLATLLLAVTVVAVAMFAWLRFVTPNVTGFHIQNGDLVLHLSDELGRELVPDDPFDANASDPNVFVHAAFVALPLYLLMILAALTGCVITGIGFGVRRLAGGRARRDRKTPSFRLSRTEGNEGNEV